MTADAATPWRQDIPIIGTIGLAHAGSHFCHLILPPLFPFIVADIGLTYVQLGLVMSVFFAVSGLLQVIAGFCVDRLGADRILGAGLTLLGIGALVAATANGFEQMLLGAVLLGIGNSVFHPADYAILGYHVSSGRLGRAFSIHTIGGSIGWATAPPLMTLIAFSFDWRVALIVASTAGFGLALLILLMRDKLSIPQTTKSNDRRIDLSFLRERPVLMCFLFFTLQAFVIMSLQSFLPVALNDLFSVSMTTAALMLSGFLLGTSAGTLLGGIVADRNINQEFAIILGYGLSGVCLFLIGTITMPHWALFVMLALAGAFKGFTTPSRDLLIRSVAGPARVGSVFGVVYSGLDLGGTIAPYATALLFDAEQPGWFFPMLAAMTMMTILTVIGARQKS